MSSWRAGSARCPRPSTAYSRRHGRASAAACSQLSTARRTPRGRARRGLWLRWSRRAHALTACSPSVRSTVPLPATHGGVHAARGRTIPTVRGEAPRAVRCAPCAARRALCAHASRPAAGPLSSLGTSPRGTSRPAWRSSFRERRWRSAASRGPPACSGRDRGPEGGLAGRSAALGPACAAASR